MELSIVAAFAVFYSWFQREPGRASRPRITVVCENYWPEVASTAQLITALAESLTQRFDVEVLASQPRYHGTYGKRPGSEVRNGVNVKRLWSTRFDKKNKAGRLSNWFSFLASASLAVATRWKRRTYLFVTNPPTAPWAAAIARLQRQHAFILVHDLYPDLAVAMRVLDAGSSQARVFDKLNIASFRSATAVVALGADMEERLRGKLGPQVRIEVLPNWADGDLICPRPKATSAFAIENGLIGKTVFLYAGNFGLFQDLEVLIDAVERLDKRSKVRLVFVGDGGMRPVVDAAAQRSDRIMVFDYLPYERLGDLYAAADVGLITIEPGVEMANMPSKTYSILASGRPFIAVAGNSRDLQQLAGLGAGIVVDNDVTEVCGAMQLLRNDSALRRSMGATARRIFEETYTRSRVTAMYAALLAGEDPADASAKSQDRLAA